MKNLARDKSAVQSSTHSVWYASLATDGFVEAISDKDRSFSHTHGGAGQWWRVDLLKNYMCNRIEIFNRQFTCTYQPGLTSLKLALFQEILANV